MSYNEKERAFIAELRELQNKHNVKLEGYEQYNENGFSGIDWEFSNSELEIYISLDREFLRELENAK